MAEGDMGDAAGAEEGRFAPSRPVDELVDQDEQAGIEFGLVGTAGRKRDQIGDAGALQHVDIGAVVDLAGRNAVARPVPRQEGKAHAAEPAHGNRTRRLAERTRDRDLLRIVEADAVGEARAADHADVPAVGFLPAVLPISVQGCLP